MREEQAVEHPALARQALKEALALEDGQVRSAQQRAQHARIDGVRQAAFEVRWGGQRRGGSEGGVDVASVLRPLRLGRRVRDLTLEGVGILRFEEELRAGVPLLLLPCPVGVARLEQGQRRLQPARARGGERPRHRPREASRTARLIGEERIERDGGLMPFGQAVQHAAREGLRRAGFVRLKNQRPHKVRAPRVQKEAGGGFMILRQRAEKLRQVV